MHTFQIIPNVSKKWALNLEKKIEFYLKSKNYKKSKSPDFTIVIGGDGSFYYSLNDVKGKVILIGSETTYRSQISKNNWKSHLLNLIKNNKSVKLPLISVYKKNKLISSGVNDIVFHSLDFKVSNFKLKIKKSNYSYRGDGLIVSTPFGSTAYSYSAGGSKLSLKSKKLILTPICPYLRKFKTTTISNSEKIIIECDGNALLMIDGIIKQMKCKGIYEVIKSKKSIDFLIN